EIPVQVVGMDTWLNFRDPEMLHWEKLNTLIPVGYAVDRQDSLYKQFYTQYRANQTTPPSEFSLKGYDQMMFFGNALMAFGKFFPKYVLDTEFKGVGTDF